MTLSEVFANFPEIIFRHLFKGINLNNLSSLYMKIYLCIFFACVQKSKLSLVLRSSWWWWQQKLKFYYNFYCNVFLSLIISVIFFLSLFVMSSNLSLRRMCTWKRDYLLFISNFIEWKILLFIIIWFWSFLLTQQNS